MSSPIQESKGPIFLHLDLSLFKTERCPSNNPHDAKKCFYYHFPSERRRSLCQVYYQKNLCPGKSDCSNENCNFAHNFVEQIYHVDSYKKRYCKDFVDKGRCKYDAYCAMAHSDLELKITPLHLLPVDKNFLLFRFKKEFCPFSKISHDRFKCVYAHNWQDYKRPYNPSIQPSLCKNWDRNKEILEYEQGCEKGFHCNFSHGWKEVEYHYLNFKRQLCKMGAECDRREICSFLHENEEIEKDDLQDELFYPCDKAMLFGKNSTISYLINIEVDLKKATQSISNCSSYREVRKAKFPAQSYSPIQDYEDEDADFDNKYGTKFPKRIDQQEETNRHFSSKNIAGEHQLAERDVLGKAFNSEKHIYGLVMNKSGQMENSRKNLKMTQGQKLTSFEQKNFSSEYAPGEISETTEGIEQPEKKAVRSLKIDFALSLSYSPFNGFRCHTQKKEPQSKAKPTFEIVSINFKEAFNQKSQNQAFSHYTISQTDKKSSSKTLVSEKTAEPMPISRRSILKEKEPGSPQEGLNPKKRPNIGRQKQTEVAYRQINNFKVPSKRDEEDF